MHNIVHRKTNLSHTTTDYVGNFVFEGGEFKRYNFDDGYIFPYWKPETQTYSQGYNYYIKDHQGNIRMIVNNNGTVSQVNHLTAYGASMGNSYNQEFNKYKYNGKELDRMHGLDLYDYGARQYDPAIGSFTSMDPLAEKYYHINPYAYCAGNPIRYVDPDGRYLIIYYDNNKFYTYTEKGHNAPLPNNRFVKQVLAAYNYNKRNWIKTYGTKEKSPSMKAALAPNRKYVIYEGQEQTYSNGAVSWNPKLGLKTINDIVMSPASALDHELDHAVRAQENNLDYKTDRVSPDKDYDNLEEKRVITGSEQKTALANNEIKKGQITRSDHHNGEPVIVKGDVSSTIIDKVRTNEWIHKKNNWSSGH